MRRSNICYRCGSRQSRNLVELCGSNAQAKLGCKCNLLLQGRMFSGDDIFAEDISVEDITEEDISIQLVDNFIILC